MKKTILLAAAAAMVLATGCNKESGVQPANEAGAIEFRTIVDKGETRAAIVGTIDDLNSFFVDATSGAAPTDFDFLSTAAYKEGANWTYSPKRYLPSNGDKVDFYAYSPIKDRHMSNLVVVSGGAAAKFDYEVPADQSKANSTVDLLVARGGIAQNASSGATTLNFVHGLSAVTFSGANKNDVSSELTYVVSKVTIKNVNKKATFTYPATITDIAGIANAWTTPSTKADFVAGIPASGVALVAGGASATPKNLLSDNERMMVIPQSFTTTELANAGDITTGGGALTTKTYVEVMYSLKDGSGAPIVVDGVRNIALPASFKFVPGTRYNFAFGFDTTMVGAQPLVDIDFTVNLVAWGNDTDTITTIP